MLSTPRFQETEAALASVHRCARSARRTPPVERAAWLDAVAVALDAARDELVAIAARETHLPLTTLTAELARTTFQARLFADRLREGRLVADRLDEVDPGWPTGARPRLLRTHVAIGPVLVFAASNFPFAFSVVGGDTVSALAAGCPVVVKTHPGHPELSRATGRIATTALARAGAPAGLLRLVAGLDAGLTAVRDPRVRAVAFTGSLHGGRALFDLAAARPDPIPFYGELGSINPVVVTPDGWSQRGREVAAGFGASLTTRCGQLCTKPGFVLVPDAAAFVASLPATAVGPMLNETIAVGYTAAVEAVLRRPGVTMVTGPVDHSPSAPLIMRADAAAVLADPDIAGTECFGPAAVICEYADTGQLDAVIATLGGSLTATIQAAGDDDPVGARVLDRLTELAGRVVWNQWPTGVSVTDAQQHGGPWPATTAPTTTSVGTASVWRFLRPVAYQNVPAALLSESTLADVPG